MSHQKGRLVSEILNSYFGEIVQKVGNDLFTFGSKPLSLIIKTTRLTRSQVVESLRALLKYDLASFEPSHIETIPNYRLNADNVILLLRYPRYLLQIKTKFGTEAELIVEEFLQNGCARATQLLISIANKYKDDKDKNINIVVLKDTFISLVTAGYIQQAPIADAKENSEVPTLISVVTIVPELDTRGLLQALATGDDSTLNDTIYWKVNFDRFHQDFRDELMIKAIVKIIDENAGELMRQLLTHMYLYSPPWAPTSNPVPIQDLKAAVERTPDRPLLKNHLEQYLKVMEESGYGLVIRCGETGGGRWAAAPRRASILAMENLLDVTIIERLGHHAARIFRLIRCKKYIEEEEIQKHAMLPNKQCKELTYRLLEEHFISVQPMRKAASNGSMAKAVYLYHIDTFKAANMVLEICYRAMSNMCHVGALERRRHARLLDKVRRVRTIVHGMRLRGESQENIDDIEDTVTPPERAALEAAERRLRKLSTAELEFDRALFVVYWYFMYNKHE